MPPEAQRPKKGLPSPPSKTGTRAEKLPEAVKSSSGQATKTQKRTSTKKEKTPYNTVKPGDIDLGGGWFLDKKTGKKFHAIPKLEAELLGDGSLNPVAQGIENSIYDFNSSAGDFLAHLQVPPSQKQMLKIQEAREKREKIILGKYDQKWKGSEEVEETPEKKPSVFVRLIQKITGKR